MQFQKLPKAAIIVLESTILFLTLTTVTATQNQSNNSAKKTVTAINLAIYSDSTCKHTITTINFLNINPGSTVTQTIYIKNTGNLAETLTMTANNWNPNSVSRYLNFSWNRQNIVLAAGASIQATLTLTATANIGSLTNFSADVTFTGTQ